MSNQAYSFFQRTICKDTMTRKQNLTGPTPKHSVLRMADPDLKKRKLEYDQIFDEFRKNPEKMSLLRKACNIIHLGHSDMTVRLLKVRETNARSSVSFTNATCDVSSYKKKNKHTVLYSIGSIFSDGIKTLQMYLMDDKDKYCLPKESKPRAALAKLLKFLIYDEDSFEDLKQGQSEYEWTVQVAQHLLSKLSLKSKFTLEHHYSKEAVKSVDGKLVCPCGKSDLVEEGEFGDTSFGCPGAWHGSVDILLENMSIKMNDTSSFSQGKDQLSSESSDDSSQSSVGVKMGEQFSTRDKSQLLSQCIVFSFLQQNQSQKAINLLIPSMAINANKIIVTFYDSENDILLQTRDLPLIIYDYLDKLTVVFLWLTLNYRCFCSGITDTMKAYKANFFECVGDFLPRYKLETTRPVQRTSISEEDEGNWARDLDVVVEETPPVISFLDVEKQRPHPPPVTE